MGRRAGLMGVAAVVALSLGEAGCLVQITHVSDPGPIFSAARAEAERLSGRRGRASELNVLVWSPDDRELVRVSLPMWIVRKAERRIDWREEEFESGRDTKDRVRDALRRVRLEDIEKAGLGILAEVEEEGGDQVLVWLR
jgi:hypothetical protein